MRNSYGIAHISTLEPDWVLENSWFRGKRGVIRDKFEKHTGIERRGISLDDEATMIGRVIKKLKAETGCSLNNCTGLVLASSSLTTSESDPDEKYLGALGDANEVAKAIAKQLHVPDENVSGVMWGCCGYVKAFEVMNTIADRTFNARDAYALVLTVNRTSKFTDFGCKKTGAIFGDYATATLLTPENHPEHPPYLLARHASTSEAKVDDPFFRFDQKNNVLVPSRDGGEWWDPERLCLWMDATGVGYNAPGFMLDAAENALSVTDNSGRDVNWWVPHQAGEMINVFLRRLVEAKEFGGEFPMGLTKNTGNISSSSVPHALHKLWGKLSGIVCCPVAGMLRMGEPVMGKGCLILEKAVEGRRKL